MHYKLSYYLKNITFICTIIFQHIILLPTAFQNLLVLFSIDLNKNFILFAPLAFFIITYYISKSTLSFIQHYSRQILLIFTISASLAEDSKPRTVDVEKRESNNKINESKRPCNVRQFSAFPSKESKKHYVPSLNNTRKRDKSPANDDNPDDGAEWTLISKKREKKRYQSFPPTNTPTKTFSCSFSSSENVERSGKLINTNNLAYIADGTTSKTGPITVIPRQTWASPTEQYEYSPSLSNNDSCSTVSSTKSPTTSHLELFLQMTEKYYSPFITGFDLGVAPAQISINDFMFYDSRKLDHHLLSQARFHKNESPETDKSYLISPYLDEVDMVHEPSIVNFLNQVDSEDTAFFSKRLETKYKIFIS